MPVSSVFFDPTLRKRCFQITLPNGRNSQLIVEIRTDWNLDIASSPEHASQLQVAREVYQISVRGRRLFINAFGTVMPF